MSPIGQDVYPHNWYAPFEGSIASRTEIPIAYFLLGGIGQVFLHCAQLMDNPLAGDLPAGAEPEQPFSIPWLLSEFRKKIKHF